MSENIWITRHGSRQDFVDPEWVKSAEYPHDPPLCPEGVIQARQLAVRLRQEPIRHIFASPFLRTVETAHYTAEALGLPIKIEFGLSEWLNAEWFPNMPNLIPMEQKRLRFPRIDAAYSSRFTPAKTENSEELLQRSETVGEWLRTEVTGDVLIVTHGALVRNVACQLLGGDVEMDSPYCCLTKIVRKPQGWHLELNASTAHLS